MKTTNIQKVFLFGLVFLLAVISGCKKVSYYKLTDEEMLWLSYKNNEVLRFSNGAGLTRIFYVTLRSKAYIKEGDQYNEFTNAHFLQINDTTTVFPEDSQGDLYIYKAETGLQVTFTWPHFGLKETPLTSLVPSLENVGGINYPDVYKLNGSGLTDLRNYYSKVWVSKSRGVLKIEDTFGNTWTRVF